MDFTGRQVAANEWFAVQVWAGRERLSAAHLQLRGYDVFLPRYRQSRRWSDRIKSIETPLFAGYVFCRLGSDIVNRLVTAPGVIRIVGDSHGPLPIPEAEIGAIRRITDAQLAVEPWPMPRVGQRVCVECGPLRGIEGIVQTIKNQQRLVISVSLLQRAVAVEIESAWISVLPELPELLLPN